MLQITLVGNLGADAQFQEKDGSKFTTFRVAHNERWKGADGVTHDNVMWVDCILSDHPKVAEFLKAGTMVCVQGSVSLRVYSSEKDRCMKAGMTIRVRHIELLGGRGDDVPSRLYDANGVMHNVQKYYATDVNNAQLSSERGDKFFTDANGWVVSGERADVANNAETSSNNGTKKSKK
jgi:single-strand DNA-binding protein